MDELGQLIMKAEDNTHREVHKNPVNSVLVVDQENDFYQYPKEISQLWRYSFVIPVEIKLKDEEYPYQVVLHKYEDLKINEESMVEDVKRLVKEIEKRVTQDSGLNSNDTT